MGITLAIPIRLAKVGAVKLEKDSFDFTCGG